MPANYVLLEKITVGAAGASSVTFSGIPQTGYTDLVLKGSARGTIGGTAILNASFNGSTTNFTDKYIEGNGSTVGSYADQPRMVGLVNGSSTTANTFTSFEVYIPNYTSANYKSFSADIVSENNATTAYIEVQAGLWSDTAAITSIALTGLSSSFVQYSTFYLYGVAKLGTTPAIVPYATGGDTIMTDGTYWFHTFLSSGTFTPAKGLSCDYLVVAGGGGGGSRSGGGGGAGGLRCTVSATGGGGALETGLTLSQLVNYTVTVGAGGTAGSRSVNGTNGANSVFSSVTSNGGGFGGSAVAQIAGNAGGSGGGPCNGSTVGGAPTSGQGFTGGSSNTTSFDGAGGGGAGAVGANASSVGLGSGAGNGGNGVATSISGSSVTYAGGGGGGSFGSANHGTGGTGGGGNGADATPTAGGTNTGGGGGGAGNSANTNTVPTGANGGSGVVIIRYAV